MRGQFDLRRIAGCDSIEMARPKLFKSSHRHNFCLEDQEICARAYKQVISAPGVTDFGTTLLLSGAAIRTAFRGKLAV